MINYGKFRHPSFVVLPTIINAPGKYLTRGGKTVVITNVRKRNYFSIQVPTAYAAEGYYPKDALPEGHHLRGVQDIAELWDVSGRIFSGKTCDNDIVCAA